MRKKRHFEEAAEAKGLIRLLLNPNAENSFASVADIGFDL